MALTGIERILDIIPANFKADLTADGATEFALTADDLIARLIDKQTETIHLEQAQKEALKQDVKAAIEKHANQIEEETINEWENARGNTITITLNNQPYEVNQKLYLFLLLQINTEVATARLEHKFGRESPVYKLIIEATSNERFIRPLLIDHLRESCPENITRDELEEKLHAPDFLKLRDLITTYGDASECYQSLFYSHFLHEIKDREPNESVQAIKAINMTLKQTSSMVKLSSKLIDSMNKVHQVATHVQTAKDLKIFGGVASIVSQVISTVLDPVLWYLNYKREKKKPSAWDVFKWTGSIAGLCIGAVLFASIAGPIATAALITAATTISLVKTIGDFIAQERRVKKLKKEVARLDQAINERNIAIETLKKSYYQDIRRLSLMVVTPTNQAHSAEIIALNERVAAKTKQLGELNKLQQSDVHKLIETKHRYNKEQKDLRSFSTIITKVAYSVSAITAVIGAVFLFIPPLAPVGLILLGAAAVTAATTFTVSMIAKGINHLRKKHKEKKGIPLNSDAPDEEPIDELLAQQQHEAQKEYRELFSYKFHKNRSNNTEDLFTSQVEHAHDSQLLMIIREIELGLIEGSTEDLCQMLYLKRAFILAHKDEFLALIESSRNNLALNGSLQRLHHIDASEVATMKPGIIKAFFSNEREEIAEVIGKIVSLPTYTEEEIQEARQKNVKSFVESFADTITFKP